MNSPDKTARFKKTRNAYWINFSLSIISMNILLESIDSLILWKMIASSIGFLGFISLTCWFYRQLIRLQQADDDSFE